MGRELKKIWPTLSARTLAEAPASFEATAAALLAVADRSESIGSCHQTHGQLTAELCAMVAQTAMNRRLPRWAIRALVAIQAMSHGGTVRVPSMENLRQIGAGLKFFRAAGAERWVRHPSVRLYRTLGRLSPGAARVFLDGMAEAKWNGLPTAAKDRLYPVEREEERLRREYGYFFVPGIGLDSPLCRAAHDRYVEANTAAARLRKEAWDAAEKDHAAAQMAAGMAAVIRVQRGGDSPKCPIPLRS